MKKIIKRVLTILVIFLITIFGVSYIYLLNLKPKYQGELILKGLKEEVEIYFDKYGIPHIYAQNEEDAYYALGYLHAQERLFQMEMARRVANGRLAEVFGEDLVPTDRLYRTIGIRENAKASAEKYLFERKTPYQKAVWAYIDGFNNYIENGQTPLEYTLLGLEKENLHPEDIYSIMGYTAFSFNFGLITDPVLSKLQKKLGDKYLRELSIDWNEGSQLIPVYPKLNKKESDSILEKKQLTKAPSEIFENLPIPIWIGSNSWVVTGKKTKSGKPFFANDPHISFAQPSIYYEAHLEYPGVSFYGNYTAGLPFAFIGHSQRHAWGLTILLNDDTDFYLEQINPENTNQAKFKETWEDLEIRQEIIKIKGKESFQFEVKHSRHGPLINDILQRIDELEGAAISLFWVHSKFPDKTIEAFYQMAIAKNMQDFEKACALIHAPGLNITYGDVDGNIAWWTAAKYVKRPSHVHSKFILDGASGKDEILGYYDFSKNPKSINPPSNFVYSANNQPDSAFGILPFGYYVPEHRSKRITSLLEKENAWDVKKMKAMHLDGVSPNYPLIAQEIVRVIEKQENELSKNQMEVLTILKNWKGEHNLESSAPIIYYKLIYNILLASMKDEMGEQDLIALIKTFVIKRTIPILIRNDKSIWWDNITTKTKETRSDIFQKALEITVAELEEQFGANPTKWQWQKVHTVTHKHSLGKQGGFLAWLFNVGTFPINGGDEVLNANSFQRDGDGLYPVLYGPAARILIDFSDPKNALSILPTGQSGRLMSPHYDDQAQMFVEGKYRKQMMDEDEIKANSKKLVLKPK